jgi:hypothetical protein
MYTGKSTVVPVTAKHVEQIPLLNLEFENSNTIFVRFKFFTMAIMYVAIFCELTP